MGHVRTIKRARSVFELESASDNLISLDQRLRKDIIGEEALRDKVVRNRFVRLSILLHDMARHSDELNSTVKKGGKSLGTNGYTVMQFTGPILLGHVYDHHISQQNFRVFKYFRDL